MIFTTAFTLSLEVYDLAVAVRDICGVQTATPKAAILEQSPNNWRCSSTNTEL